MTRFVSIGLGVASGGMEIGLMKGEIGGTVLINSKEQLYKKSRWLSKEGSSA